MPFLLKYAEIIKYANDVNNNYAYYGRNFNVNNVVLSNTGLDELFEILKGKTVEFETIYKCTTVRKWRTFTRRFSSV